MLLYWSMTQFSVAVPLLGGQLTNLMDRVITGEKEPFIETSIYPAAGKMISALSKATNQQFGKAAADFGQAMGYFIGAPVSGVKDIIRAAEADGFGDVIGKLAGRRE